MKRGRVVYVRGGKKFFINDVEVSEKEFHKTFPTKIKDILKSGLLGQAHTKTCWPMVSDAVGVHPDQVEEANARNKKHGLATRYNEDGQAIIPSRLERKKLLQLEQFFDRDGGYGD